MADGIIIADCNTFSFPEFFSQEVHSLVPSVPVDGEEFVAQTKIKAGVFVSVFEIPIINIGVNAAADIPTLCSLYLMKQNKGISDMTNFLSNLVNRGAGVYDPLTQPSPNS